MFLYEIHCHTREVSICSRVPGERLAKIHIDNGLKGVCITDHYYEGFFDEHTGRDTKYVIDKYLEGYANAKNSVQNQDFDVLLGMELRFNENKNDYLVYGFDKKFLYENPLIYKMGIKEFKKYIKGTDIVIIQAHPFRNNMTVVDNQYLDGVEVHNGNLRHESRNELAKMYADKHGLIQTCGSDFHRTCDVKLSPMEFNYRIEETKSLVKALRNKEYKF